MGRKSKDYSEREQIQDRKFECIIYEDSEDYDYRLIINRLSSFWDQYFYIRHDCDSFTELDVDKWKLENKDQDCPFVVGELKKVHWHLIGYSNSPCLLGRAATKFGVPSNYVQNLKNFKKSVQYLIHLNNPEKFQYDANSIKFGGCEQKELDKLLKKDCDTLDKARVLIDYISVHPSSSLYDLTLFAIEQGCYDELRRGQHLFIQLLRDMTINYSNRGAL